MPIRKGAFSEAGTIAEGIRGVSRKALRAIDSVRNKKIDQKVAEFTKDSVVKNKVYHGTNVTFSKFDHSKIGSSSGTAQGRGFYFTSNKLEASGYGKKVKEFYLNMKKPMVGSLNDGFSQKEITMKQVEKMAAGEDLSNWGMTHSEGLSKLKKAISGDNDLDKIQELGQTVFHHDWKRTFEKLRKITGIDGSIRSNTKTTHFVAYNSDQIMKAPKRSNLYKSIQKIKYRKKS